MSKNKVTSKRKLSESPDPAMETDQEDSEGKSPSPELGRIKLASASEERRPTIFEDDIQDSQVTSHPREVDGAPRPPRGGYHVQEYGRRAGPEWGEDYPLRYGQGPGGSFRGSVRRPVSASPFIGGRDYDGRGAEYSGRMLHYDGRSDFPERRGIFTSPTFWTLDFPRTILISYSCYFNSSILSKYLYLQLVHRRLLSKVLW